MPVLEDPVRILVLRLTGVMSLVVAAASAALVAANRVARLHGGHDLRFLLVLSCFALALGMGLLLRRKWSVVLLVTGSVLSFIPFALGLVRSPDRWSVLGLVIAGVTGLVIVAPVVWAWPACRGGI